MQHLEALTKKLYITKLQAMDESGWYILARKGEIQKCTEICSKIMGHCLSPIFRFYLEKKTHTIRDKIKLTRLNHLPSFMKS